jgi:hypothetical protein
MYNSRPVSFQIIEKTVQKLFVFIFVKKSIGYVN